jgi:hypothetical protein
VFVYAVGDVIYMVNKTLITSGYEPQRRITLGI